MNTKHNALLDLEKRIEPEQPIFISNKNQLIDLSGSFTCKKAESIKDMNPVINFLATRYLEEGIIKKSDPNGEFINYIHMSNSEKADLIGRVSSKIRKDFLSYPSSTYVMLNGPSEQIVSTCSVFYSSPSVPIVNGITAYNLPTEKLIGVNSLDELEIFRENIDSSQEVRIAEIGKLAQYGNLPATIQMELLDKMFHEIYIDSRNHGVTHQIISTSDPHSKFYVSRFGFKHVHDQETSDVIDKEVKVSLLNLEKYTFPIRNSKRVMRYNSRFEFYNNNTRTKLWDVFDISLRKIPFLNQYLEKLDKFADSIAPGAIQYKMKTIQEGRR